MGMDGPPEVQTREARAGLEDGREGEPVKTYVGSDHPSVKPEGLGKEATVGVEPDGGGVKEAVWLGNLVEQLVGMMELAEFEGGMDELGGERAGGGEAGGENEGVELEEARLVVG